MFPPSCSYFKHKFLSTSSVLVSKVVESERAVQCTHTHDRRESQDTHVRLRDGCHPTLLSSIPDMLIPVIAGRRGEDKFVVSKSRCVHAVRLCRGKCNWRRFGDGAAVVWRLRGGRRKDMCWMIFSARWRRDDDGKLTHVCPLWMIDGLGWM